MKTIYSDFSNENNKRWDKYVLSSRHTTFYHQIGWKNVVEKTFKHRPYYLFIEHNGNITGILPLFLIKSIFFGKSLVSVPFGGAYAGACADNPLALKLLIEEAIKLAKHEKVNYLELRQEDENYSGLAVETPFVNFVIDLQAGKDNLWKNIGDSAKSCVKKALEANLSFKTGNEYLNAFYRIFCRNMKELGTPVYSYSFLENILKEFPASSGLAIVEFKGKVIAGALNVFFKDTITGIFSCSLKKYIKLHPNHFLYWETMKYGCENNYRSFNTGKTREGSGVYAFKQRWGARPKKLFYHYYLSKSKTTPLMHPSNPRYNLYIKMWKMLPLTLANAFGPKIIRGIP